MQVEQLDIDELIPYKKNPRNNDEAVLYVANSIDEFGFKVPIVIDKNNVIIAGHTRLEASRYLELETVPVIRADDLTEEQTQAFRLADNKTSEFAEWDTVLLEQELRELEMNMEQFGFDELSDDILLEDVEDDEFDEELPEEPKSKYGDIYQLGEHRLMCGDSTSERDATLLFDGETADITFTSPPYNAGDTVEGKDLGETDSKYLEDTDDMTQEDYAKFLTDYLKLTLKHSEYSFMNIQMLAGNKVALQETLYELRENLADTIIWDKGHAAPALPKNVLNSRFEFIHAFSKEGTRFLGTVEFWGILDNVITDIGKQGKNEYAKIHSATFPIELPAYFIHHFAENSVYDPFCGTGTALIASEQLNKKCYAMELEPKYVDLIIDRWEAHTEKEAIKIN